MVRDSRKLRERVSESVPNQERGEGDVDSVGSGHGFDEIVFENYGCYVREVGAGVRFSSDLCTHSHCQVDSTGNVRRLTWNGDLANLGNL